MCCVHVSLPIIARLSISKDLHLEVPHHGVHHLPGRQKEHDSKPQKEATIFNNIPGGKNDHAVFSIICILIFNHWLASQKLHAPGIQVCKSYKIKLQDSMCISFSNQWANLPVDPPRPFLRLDVDFIVIDINFGNLHLEVIGKEPDGFPHCAEAGTPRRLKQRGWGGRAWRESILMKTSTFKSFTHLYRNM